MRENENCEIITDFANMTWYVIFCAFSEKWSKMRKIKTKAELKALGDQFPQPPPPVEFEEPERSILEPVFYCDICSQVFECEEDLTNHEIKHMKLTCGLCKKVR